MGQVRRRVKNAVTKAPAGATAARLMGRLVAWADVVARRLSHPEVQRSNIRLTEIRNSRVGERCVIIGNGPSLNHVNLMELEGQPTIALNRGYLKFDEYGLSPDFLVCVNPWVARQFGSELESVDATRIFSLSCAPFVRAVTTVGETVFVQSVHGPSFKKDIRRGVWEGGTVTYVAMQVAYFLGFSEVVLVGVDHSFADKGNANEAVTARGPDRNHFSPDYFGTGTIWQLPDLETSEVAYSLAKAEYRKSGRRIVNSTVGGKLEIFERAQLRDALSSEGA